MELISSTCGTYDLNGTNTNTVSGIKVISTGNPKLKWETTTQTNIGLDAFLIDNTLSLTVDYYWKRTKDMITVPPVLKVAGENAERYMNTGEMKNHGFEANLNYHSPQYGKFSWEGNLNFSMYRNKLVKLNDEVSVIGGDFRFIEGQPLGVYYGYVCDGIFRGSQNLVNAFRTDAKGLPLLDGTFNRVNVDENYTGSVDPRLDFTVGRIGLPWRGHLFTMGCVREGTYDIYGEFSNKKAWPAPEEAQAATTPTSGACIPSSVTSRDRFTTTRVTTSIRA